MHEVDLYKGNKILVLRWHDLDPFALRFGLQKAELIIDNLDSIKEFIKKYRKEE